MIVGDSLPVSRYGPDLFVTKLIYVGVGPLDICLEMAAGLEQ